MSEKGKGESRTVIGPTIRIRGVLKTDEDLVIKGRIDAEINSNKSVEIENTGIVKANVNVASARISGIVVGNVTASTRVELASDGRLVGDLLAPRIVINDGAAIKGRIDMQNFDETRSRAKRSSSVEAPIVPAWDPPTAPVDGLYAAEIAAAADGEGDGFQMGAAPLLDSVGIKEDSAPRGRRRRG